MFIGPWEQGGPWNPRGVEGVVRFLNRAKALVLEAQAVPGDAPAGSVRELQRAVHQTLRKVTGDIERFSYNTVVSGLMELSKALQRHSQTPVSSTPEWRDALEKLVLMLAPVAPHVAEELWEALGNPYSVHQQPWPQWSEELAAEDAVEIVVQINGKVRDRISVPVDADEEAVVAAALASEKVQSGVEGKQVRKRIYVPGKLLNLVVG
jgi:leucyl-tRNA synthetase